MKMFLNNKHMNSLAQIKNNVTPYIIAVFVPTFLSVIGFGVYHGTFHMNAHSSHCHADNVCHNH